MYYHVLYISIDYYTDYDYTTILNDDDDDENKGIYCMTRKKDTIIKCPVCGAEYLPSEIFFPNDLIGKQTEIVKDERGKVLHYDDCDLCLEQEFVCEHCGNRFITKATVSYQTCDPDADFSDESVIKIRK